MCSEPLTSSLLGPVGGQGLINCGGRRLHSGPVSESTCPWKYEVLSVARWVLSLGS